MLQVWANLLPRSMLPYDKDRWESFWAKNVEESKSHLQCSWKLRKLKTLKKEMTFCRHTPERTFSCRLTIHKNFLRVEYPQVPEKSPEKSPREKWPGGALIGSCRRTCLLWQGSRRTCPRISSFLPTMTRSTFLWLRCQRFGNDGQSWRLNLPKISKFLGSFWKFEKILPSKNSSSKVCLLPEDLPSKEKMKKTWPLEVRDKTIVHTHVIIVDSW